MPYTPEESDEIVRAMGKNPWEYTVREVDGVPHLVPTPTEGRGALEFGLRKLASDAPRAMTSAVGGKFGGAIAEPLATAAGTAIGGPLGGLAGFGVGALGFMGGGALATGAYDATLGKGVDDILLGSEQQQKRDAAEHPFVNRAAHIGSQLAGFKLLNPKVLGSGLAKLGTLSNLAVKDLGMNVAERAAVTGLAANPVIGGVTEAINQKVHGKPLDWKEIGISAASALPFGDTRSKLGRIGTAMGNPFKYAAEKALGQPSSRPIKPRTIEPVQYPETAEAPPVMPTVRPGELSDVVSRENDAVREASTIAALANLEAEPPGLPAGRATGILADQMAAAREQAAAGQQQPPPPYDLEHNLGDILANVQTQMRNIRSAQEPPRVSILPQPPKIGLLPDMPLGGAKPLPPSRPSPFDRDSKAAILSAIDQSLPKVRPPLPPFEVPAPKWPRMSEPWRRTPTPFDADLEAARRAEVDKIAQAEQAREAEARAAEEQAQQLPADQLRQALQQNQILGAPEAPRSQVTPFSRPEFFGPDRGLPQEGPRTELETLQDWMEGRKVKFQGPKGEAADAPLASAADIAGGREALIRRGRRFGEVDAPIQMPDGRLASGFFHEPTGDIIVSRANTRPTTYEHEGMHAELQDMALSDNPAVQARAKELLAAVQDEEQLAELGAEASRAQRGQNRVLRLLRDNWNFFRTTKLGGGDMTPERAARMLATRFDFHAPEAAKGSEGGAKFQPSEVGYHFGDGQIARDTTLHRMDAGRSTGHFGTGTYFFGKPENMTGREGRPVREIDLTGKNLAKPSDPRVLHDGLRAFNRAVLKQEPFDLQAPGDLRKAAFNVRLELGLKKHSDVAMEQALREVYDLFAQGKNDKLRTPSTYLMQKLGYDGIDVRGTALDNADYGSVLYPVQAPEQFLHGLKHELGHVDDASNLGEDSVRDERVAEEFAAKYRADDPEFTPNSVIGKLAPIHPAAAKAVADFFNTKDQLIGGLFNGPMERLHAAPKELVAAVEAKRLRAMKTGVPPQFTAEEIPINAEYDRMMKASKDVADQTGYPIGAIQYYVPEMLDMQMARQISRNNDKFFNEHWGEFDAHNRAIYGSEYNPDDAAAYLRKYLKGVSKAPNSLGSDFGALTKNARQYHLPDNWRETDPIRALGRYGDRFAIQIAKRQHFLNDTELAQDVGMIPTEDNRFADIPEMQNARMAVENTLFNQGRGASGLSDNAKDLFTGVQRIAYSLGMQTLTGLKNTVQKLPFHLIHAGSAEELEAMMEGTLRSLHDYTAQREKALGANVIRPGQDPRMITDQYSLSNKLAKNFDDAANLMRKYTGAEGIENINRVHDYSIGEALAELHMEHPETPEAKKFFNRYGFGAAETMSAEKQISRMARNYAKSVQGSYGAEGLPAAMLKGGLMGQVMRINRFGIENMNRTYKYVLKPAAEGDFGPLLRYLFGAVLAAPVLQKMSEAITGKDSGLPTNEEIAAGQRNPMLEHIYNVMSMAQNTGTFGFASGVAGALAAGVRGKKQMVVGDPVITFGANAVGAVGAAIDAIQEGQPVVPTLLEASQRALIDNMQMLRRFTQDPELAQDRNTKSNFEYLNKRRKIPAAGVLFGMGTGNLFRPKPEINPTMDAAREGDREAYLKLSPEDRRRLDNYQGGFESPQLEAEFERWIEKTQGPGGLATYRARRQAAKLKAVPK